MGLRLGFVFSLILFVSASWGARVHQDQFRSFIWINFVETMGEYKTKTFFKNFSEEDWRQLYFKTYRLFEELLNPEWTPEIEQKEIAFKTSLKGALVESWAWAELRAQQNLFCQNCLAVSDFVLMSLNGSSAPRPDGLMYEIVDGQLIIQFLFESKTGSRRANYAQAHKFYKYLIQNGLRVPEGYFRNAYILNNHNEIEELGRKNQNIFYDSYFIWERDRLTFGFSNLESQVSFYEFIPDRDIGRVSGSIMSRRNLIKLSSAIDFPKAKNIPCFEYIPILLNQFKKAL
jgi:hypothetical protein